MELIAKNLSVTYTVTRNDVLTLLRAVEFEGLVHAEVASTLVNGFLWNRFFANASSLQVYVTNYAQPINPAWFVGGEKYEKKRAEILADKKLTPEQRKTQLAIRQAAAEKRPKQANITTFSQRTEEAVVTALLSSDALPTPISTHFATPDSETEQINKGFFPVTSYTAGHNRLWAEPRVEDAGWIGYVNPFPDKVVSELASWQINVRGGDPKQVIAVLDNIFSGNADALHNRTAQSFGTYTPPTLELEGVQTSALGSSALRDKIESLRRSVFAQGQTRPEKYAAGSRDAAAFKGNWVRRTSQLTRISESVLSLSISVNALAWNPIIRQWVRATNTTLPDQNDTPQKPFPAASS